MNYRFSIIDYTINSAGVTTVLTTEPEGWKEIKIEAKRDPKWHGVFMDFTLNKLSFHAIDAGYEEIKAAYDDSGVEAETDLLVELQCEDDYEEVYRGRLMYSDYQINYGDSCSIEIGVEQKSCLRTLKSRYDQKVNLLSTTSFDASTSLPTYDFLPLENMTLFSRPIKFKDSASVVSYTQSFNRATAVINNYSFLFTGSIISDFTSFAPETNNVDNSALPVGVPILIVDSTDIDCGDNTIDINLTMDFDIYFQTNTDLSIQIFLSHRDSSDTIKSSNILYSGSAVHAGGSTFNIDSATDFTSEDWGFTVASGDKFYFYVRFGITSGTIIDVTFNSGDFTATMTSYCDDSEADVFLVHEALSRTSEIITDACLPVYSEFYGRTDSDPFSYASDGCAGNRCVANGLYIRNAIRTDGTAPDFFLSLKDLFEGLTAIDNIGMGIEDAPSGATDEVLRVEEVDYWYDNTIIHTCEDVKDIQIKIDEKRVYSVCDIGYDKWESEYTGGRDDFHSEREYRTPITQTSNRLEQKSKFIASGYVIEVMKRLGSSSEDQKYDDDIFILCLDRSYATFQPERLNSSGNNILSPLNMVNERITPVRNLMRWYRTFTAGIPSPYRIRFNAGTGNYIAELLFTDLDTCLPETQVTALKENNLISRNNFKTASEAVPLWIPELIEFKYPLSWSDFKSIRSNPKGTVKVTQGALTLYGFITSLVYEPNEGMAKWTLLRSNYY